MSRIVLFAMCLGVIVFGACKTSTSPNNSTTNGASGTILFGLPDVTVATAVVGSGTSTSHFTGYDPSFTSDGRVIYYVDGVHSADNSQHILTANLNGTNAQPLVDFQMSNTTGYVHPKMSKDGTYISFNWYDDLQTTLGTTYGTLIYLADGTPDYVLEDVWDGDWASDGRLVVSGTRTDYSLQHTDKYEGLWIYDQTFHATRLGTGLTTPRYPKWSPDHQKVVFTMNNHLWVINADGTGLKQITDGATEQTFPCWSPDGKYIACQSTGTGGVVSGRGMAIVPSDPATPSVISSSTNFWIKDNNNNATGIMEGRYNIDWK